jgi:raffinose synthase
MAPQWGCSATQVPGETQFLLLEQLDGSYVLILPLIDSGTFRATLRPNSNNNQLALRIESGDASVKASSWNAALLVASGKGNIYDLISRGVTHAAQLSGNARPRSEKEIPSLVNYFGWCTWDAMYSSVSAASIMLGLKSFKQGGVQPKFLIIDDGWQQTDVDTPYRNGNGGIGVGHHSGIAAEMIGMGSSDLEVVEAVADLLSGPGDQIAEPLHAFHEMKDAADKETEKNKRKKVTFAATTTSSTDGTNSTLGSSSTTKKEPPLWIKSAALLSVVLAYCYKSVKQIFSRGISHIEAVIIHGAKYILDNSHSTSWVMRFFTTLATGPFRSTLLRFYSTVSDHTRRLISVRANGKFASPESGSSPGLNSTTSDLKSVVDHIKSQFGVNLVYCWHAAGGFWGGISHETRDDPDMAPYNARLILPTPTPGILEIDPTVAWVQPVLAGVSLPADPLPLHQDMHKYLASCSVDGLKVDVQSTIGLVGSGGAGGGPALAATWHASLEQSVKDNFPGNHLINCMCHSTEDLYRMKDSNLARISDDFYPRNKSSHTTHIANCSYNNIFMGELVIGDWDMWQSSHEQNVLHAVARAVSGGPVYVSDHPQKHDFAILRRIVLPDGRILRAQLPGRPTADSLFIDPMRDGKSALKVWTVNKGGLAAVGVFNLQGAGWDRKCRAFTTHDPTPQPVKAMVKPSDIPWTSIMSTSIINTTGKYVMYSDKMNRFEIVEEEDSASKNQGTPGLELELAGGGGCDLVTISPIITVYGRLDDDVTIAPIGLVNMFNAGGAVLSINQNNDGEVKMMLTGSGRMLMYASKHPVAVIIDDVEVMDYVFDEDECSLMFDLGHREGVTERVCVVKF